MAEPASGRGAGTRSDVAARARRTLDLPVRAGSALVSATPSPPGDAEAVAVASSVRGDTWIVLVQIPPADAPGAARLAEHAIADFEDSASIHAAVEGARERLASSSAGAMAFGVIAVLPADGCVEVLNAGLPPVVCVQRDGTATAFSSRSAPIVARERIAHPYERVALAWNASWIMTARRPRSYDADSALARAAKLGLAGSGPALALLHPDALSRRIDAALEGDPAASATLVLASTWRTLDRGASSV